MRKYILLLFIGLTCVLNAQNIILDVPYIKQDKSNWCSAAVSKCVLDYYKKLNNEGKKYSQCKIMEWVQTVSNGYGSWGCCSPDPPGHDHPCNKGVPLGFFNERGSVKEILWRFGNLSCVGLQSVQSPATIENSLNDNLLLIAQWDFQVPPPDGPNAHAVVIRGIKNWDVYYMNPSDNPLEGGLHFLNWYTFQFHNNYKWLWTLVLTNCSGRGDYPCHCYNGIFEPEFGEKGLDCGGPCPECTTTPPPWHCLNRKKDYDETGVDCGGRDCPPCEDLPPCANCERDANELMEDCGGDCGSCFDVVNEILITHSSEFYLNYPYLIRPEFMAFNKITAKDATVKSGQKISFITEEGGAIFLLPGFKAEQGSTFKAQMREDLSGSSRICGEVCRIEQLSHHHSYGPVFLTMYGLFNAKEINYRICLSETGEKVYENTLSITRNGKFELWDCITGTVKPKGTVWYYIVYDVLYCNDASYGETYHFYVNYKSSKSPDGDPGDPENPETIFSSTIDDIAPQNETAAPNFTIVPNPNPGTFLIETNFPLSEIANLKITNMFGVPVYETQKLSSNTIQLPTTVSGQHFVVLILKNGKVLTQKMMLQR